MRSPKTKFVVISAIGLASIVGIFACAQLPTSSVAGQGLPVQLVMTCVLVNKSKLMNALNDRPSDTYRIQYEGGAPMGTLPNTSPPPCPPGFVGNATQKATFARTRELRAFMDKAGL